MEISNNRIYRGVNTADISKRKEVKIMKVKKTIKEQRQYTFETLDAFRYWYSMNDYDLAMGFYKRLIACYHLGFISRDCRTRAYHMKQDLERQMLKKLTK